MARFGHMQSIFKDRINGEGCHSGDGGEGASRMSPKMTMQKLFFYIYK